MGNHPTDPSHLAGDIELKFYPTGNIRALAAQSASGTIVLNEVRLMSQTMLHTAQSLKEDNAFRLTRAIQTNYADFQHYYTTKVIAASTEFTIDLDQFNHHSGLLVVLFRDNAALTYEGKTAYIGMGPKATFDHENVAGQSMLGTGTPIDGAFLRTVVAAKVFPSDFVNKNAVYIIPYSRNLGGAWNGEMDGFYTFTGAREHLRIVPDVQGVNKTYTYTCGAAVTAGTVTIDYKGDKTAQLAYNSTVAQLAAAVNQLASVRREGFRVSFSAALSVGTWVVSLTTPGGNPWMPHTETAGQLGFEMRLATPVTQPVVTTNDVCREGLPATLPALFRVDVYSLAFKNVEEYRGALDAVYI